jgi:predicted negative regulator of RcsB-dependent stress response
MKTKTLLIVAGLAVGGFFAWRWYSRTSGYQNQLAIADRLRKVRGPGYYE